MYTRLEKTYHITLGCTKKRRIALFKQMKKNQITLYVRKKKHKHTHAHDTQRAEGSEEERKYITAVGTGRRARGDKWVHTCTQDTRSSQS